MPNCTRCGSHNMEGARFCGNCGAPVSGVAIPNPPGWVAAAPVVYGPPKNTRRKLAKILGLCFLCLVLFVIFMPKARTPDPTQSTPNSTTAGPVQPTPDNSTSSASSTDPLTPLEKIHLTTFVSCLKSEEAMVGYETDDSLNAINSPMGPPGVMQLLNICQDNTRTFIRDCMKHATYERCLSGAMQISQGVIDSHTFNHVQ